METTFEICEQCRVAGASRMLIGGAAVVRCRECTPGSHCLPCRRCQGRGARLVYMNGGNYTYCERCVPAADYELEARRQGVAPLMLINH